MTWVEAKVPANSVPAAAVIRGGQALFRITGRKGHVGGQSPPLLIMTSNDHRSSLGHCAEFQRRYKRPMAIKLRGRVGAIVTANDHWSSVFGVLANPWAYPRAAKEDGVG